MTTTIRQHLPPPAGISQPGHPVPSARTTAPASSAFISVNNRLFAPLYGLNPNNILMGGYGWLSVTYDGTLHPGLDLNSGASCNDDDGVPIVAMLAGVVRAVLPWNGAPGEGNHLWYEVNDRCSPGPTFIHHDHLGRFDVGVGQRVVPGEPLGTCSRSGGWDCAHAHTEWCKGPPVNGWYQWPYGWSRSSVEQAYWNPYDWWVQAKGRVLAEGEDVVAMQAMNDWELTNYVLGPLYEWAGIPFNAESGMAKTWVAALRAGCYAGRPRTEDRAYGDPRKGYWAEFEHRVLIYNENGTMSWNG